MTVKKSDHQTDTSSLTERFQGIRRFTSDFGLRRPLDRSYSLALHNHDGTGYCNGYVSREERDRHLEALTQAYPCASLNILFEWQSRGLSDDSKAHVPRV